jgi:PAS domain S-box-containing protein
MMPVAVRPPEPAALLQLLTPRHDDNLHMPAAQSWFERLFPQRHRLALGAMVVAANLAAAVVAWVTLVYAREQVDLTVAVTTQNLAKSMELNFDGLIDTMDVALQASGDEISRQLASGKPDPVALSTYLQRQIDRLPGVILRASDENGKVIYMPGNLPVPSGIADREYFQRARDDPSAGLIVSKPLVGRITNTWLWLFARRVNKADGSFGGVVFGRIDLREIDKVLAQIQLYADSTIALRDSDWGLIAGRIAGAPNYPVSVGDNVMSAAFQQAFRANPREGRYFSASTKLDRVPRHFAYSQSAKYGFIVTVGVSDAVVYAEWRKHAWITAVLVAGFMLSSLLFTQLLSRAWRRQQLDMAALNAAQEIANLGSFEVDLRTMQGSGSPTARRIFGTGPETSQDARGWLNMIMEEFRGDIRAYWNNITQDRLQFDREYRIVRPSDGQTRWVSSKGKVLLDNQGQPVKVAGTVQDITERKTAELKIQELNASLEQRVAERTAELEAAVQGLRQSQEELAQSQARATLSTLVASVSHELNTPIGNSVMVATTLKQQAGRFEQAFADGKLKRSEFTEFLGALGDGTELIERNLQRAEDLLKNIRQVAADQASEQRRQFDLQSAVQEVVQTLAPSLKRFPHRVVLAVPPGIPMDSLPGPLGQVVINLINNAYLHAFEGRGDGVLTIAAEQQGDEVDLSFSDNGAGIAPDVLAKLFQPFVSTRIGQGGTGLGLAIVKNLVTKSLGGSIAVQSTLGSGTRFDIRLPRVLPQQPTQVT